MSRVRADSCSNHLLPYIVCKESFLFQMLCLLRAFSSTFGTDAKEVLINYFGRKIAFQCFNILQKHKNALSSRMSDEGPMKVSCLYK